MCVFLKISGLDHFSSVHVIIWTIQVILEPLTVAKRYLLGWFVVDFISSVPFDSVTLIFTNGEVSNSLLKASRALRIIRLAKLLSLLRLLRISRLLRFMQRWEDVSVFRVIAITVEPLY